MNTTQNLMIYSFLILYNIFLFLKPNKQGFHLSDTFLFSVHHCLCFLSSIWVLCPCVSVFLSPSVLSVCQFPWLPCFCFTFILVLTLFIYLSCLYVLWFSSFVRVCLTKFTCVYGLISLFFSCHLFPLLFFLFVFRNPFCIIVLFQRYTVCISHLYAVFCAC